MRGLFQNGKIGIGVITCNREHLFQQCIQSVPEVDHIVIVNDGMQYSEDIPSKVSELIQHKKNQGVGKSKNEALKYLLNEKCDHIFLCEDDVAIVDPTICEKYIYAAEETGLLHLNFAYHGPGNRDKYGLPTFKKVITYGRGVEIAFHRHLAGAFSYYNALVLDKVGFIDEIYRNVFDHLDHTITISKAGFHPSFGWFADIANSHLLIRDLDQDLSLSVIRKNKKLFLAKFHLYSFYFRFKNGYFVDKIPVISEIELLEQLRYIQKLYANKVTI